MDVALKLRAEYAPLRAAEIVGAESVEQLRALIQRLNSLHNNFVVEMTKNQAGAQTLRNLAKGLEIDLSDKAIEAVLAPLVQQGRERFNGAIESLDGPSAPAGPPPPKGPPTGGGAVSREPKGRPAPSTMDRRPEPTPPTEAVAEVATPNGAAKPPPAPPAPRPATVPDATAERPTVPPVPPTPRLGVERLGRTSPPASPPAAEAPPPPPPPPPPEDPPGPGGEETPEPPPAPIPGTISTVTERARRAMAIVAKPKKGAQNRADAMVDPETGDRIPVDECIVVDDLTPDASEAGGDITVHPEEA